MAWVAIGAAAVGVVGNSLLNSPSGSTTSSGQQTLDPRMQQILYGAGKTLKDGVTPTYAADGYTQTNPDSDYNTDTGVTGRINSLFDTPRTAGTTQFGSSMDDYLKNWAGANFASSQQKAGQLQNSDLNAPQVSAAQINAPSQNGLDLSGAYNNVINGNAGANPYLTSALQSGVDQTNASYQANQTSATNNLMRNILPSLRSSAVASGGYGGSRQGIAEGNAIGDYGTSLNNANLQLGLANSANTTGAQATAFNQGQDRSLSAMNTLSGQQYGTALSQAQLQQQANLANQQSILNTQQQNSANQIAGVGLSSGLLGQAYGYGTDNNNYDVNRTGAISNLLTPYTGLGAGVTSSQPYYTNTAGSALGGATAGLGLYNAYQKANPSGSGNTTIYGNQDTNLPVSNFN